MTIDALSVLEVLKFYKKSNFRYLKKSHAEKIEKASMPFFQDLKTWAHPWFTRNWCLLRDYTSCISIKNCKEGGKEKREMPAPRMTFQGFLYVVRVDSQRL